MCLCSRYGLLSNGWARVSTLHRRLLCIILVLNASLKSMFRIRVHVLSSTSTMRFPLTICLCKQVVNLGSPKKCTTCHGCSNPTWCLFLFPCSNNNQSPEGCWKWTRRASQVDPSVDMAPCCSLPQPRKFRALFNTPRQPHHGNFSFLLHWQQLASLRDSLRQRDSEIAILVNMLKQVRSIVFRGRR